MFVIGIFIHIAFLFSIFDIYFKSPIVKNVAPYQPHHETLADRLVLFMVDGLRADSFVNYTYMPYLRSIANSNGRWGISNTRVPTESRPGHVAVIAGFYEDPSAVVKGWKENPVDFDSVFNQTKYTWCWGTYDILGIFTKGSSEQHIFSEDFDPYSNTFSTDKDTTLLDEWVFSKVKTFFQMAKKNDTLNNMLKKKKIALFLHLLGTDTAGHTLKPRSQSFLSTLKYVDRGIQEIEKVIRDFYDDDGKTAFLMTSDHGMTDWGSHGAGEDHETQTPYVLWGAGVTQIMEQQILDSNGMSQTHRFDVKQADLTPLMSTILSIPVPVNSIGQLPPELLNMTLANKAKAIYSNSRQLAAQYNTKRLDVEANAIPLIYQPYQPFSEEKYQEIIHFTETLLLNEEYDKLILLSEEITNLSLSGLIYYHNYYQRPLLVLVTLSFIGWILCLLKVLAEQNLNTQSDTSDLKRKSVILRTTEKFLNVSLICLSIISVFLVYVQNLPTLYYIYFLLPILLWWYALIPLDIWVHTFRKIRRSGKTCSVGMQVVFYTVGCMALGLSFSYRWMLSVPLLGMGVWPYLTRRRSTTPVLLAWAAGCGLLSVFSFMPVVGKEVFIELVIIAGFIWAVVSVVTTWKLLLPSFRNPREKKKELILNIVQTVLLVQSLHNIYEQSRRFDEGTAVSYGQQFVAWLIAVTAPIIPMLHTRKILCRLLAINTAVLNFYLLLSVSHEGLFMVTLILNISCWIFIEFSLVHLKNTRMTDFSFVTEKYESMTTIERSISSQDFRRAFFFLLYIILAFFGTGNIASLNSFEVRWVTCFITSFQPFVITGLILLKTLAPFLCAGCGFKAVQNLTMAPTEYLNIIVLIYSNIMGIQLLYYVRNTGSWLEIGTSISQFVIVQVITLFIVIINRTAQILTETNIHNLFDSFKVRKKYV